MNRGHGFATAVVLSLGNGLLLGAALGTARPMQYLALAVGLGTCVNLAYVLAGRLWQRT